MSDIVERKIGSLTVRIKRTTCIGSANCIAVAPEIFDLDEDDIVSFLEPGEDVARDLVIEACAVCPVDALIVLDGEGRQLVP